MTGDPRFRQAREPLDDVAIEQLVRDVASGWTMPPVRLDAPSWRDRVRSPRGRRVDAARGWLGRFGQAAAAAVALTVVASLVAIVVTSPRRGPGASPDPSGSPGASPAARPSVLPRLHLPGDLPSPSRVLVRTDEGEFALVDLEKGTIGGPITGARYGSELRARADGSLLCLCLSETDRVNGTATAAAVTLDRFDRDGGLVSSTPVEAFVGQPDPRDASGLSGDYLPHVRVVMGYSEGGRYGFVGWSTRASPVWDSGVLVVDLLDGSVVSRLDLPDEGVGEGSARVVIDAPRVIGSAGAGEVLVARNRETWSGPSTETSTVAFDSDLFRVELSAGRLANAAPVPHSSDCGDRMLRAGPLPDGGVWAACSWAGETVIVRRITGDGALRNDITVARAGFIEGDTTALSADGRALFAWDPISASLTRIDLASGERTTGRAASASGRAGSTELGPLAAFGRWLAPGAAAKSRLLGAVAVSPDGSRVFAIGVTGGETEREVVGSSGVFVFDAATLEPIDHWLPTADYASLAISPDGQFVYAAGLPGVDATGRVLVNQAASITVFSAADGTIRLIAGQLGPDMLSFPSPKLD